MTVDLDPQTEQRIQREIDLGRYQTANQVIDRALSLLEQDESWSEEEKAELDHSYDEGMAACARGEGIPSDKVREVLAQRRLARVG